MTEQKSEIRGQKSEVGWYMWNPQTRESPGKASVEVCFAYLREAEFEMVSLRFELSTTQRVGLSPSPPVAAKASGPALISWTFQIEALS